jgi:3-methylfumaryl-CoA hydratase
MSAVDLEALQRWVGRSQTRCDVLGAAPVAALSATFDYPEPLALDGQPLPLCWHWLYFQEAVAASALAADGHPRRGDFLPPVELPRRMWAGGRLRFGVPLYVGDEVRRVSTVASIDHKQGRTGELVFVTVKHRVFRGENLAIEEEQDLVYREPGAGNTASVAGPAPPVAQWSRALQPDPVLLFRYSALTFNSHRIHYDRDYATGEEGYPALVVHGPLTATLLLDLLHRELPGAAVSAFEFRALRPLLEGRSLQLQGRQDGKTVSLWTLDAADAVAMEARVQLQDNRGEAR